MNMPIMPSIALPTGPYDLDPATAKLFRFEDSLTDLRAAMRECGVTHAVVHGNGFDHAALFRLTHFTPKLGPACALVPADGPLRVLFSGGPGMKPSAQKLTWVEDVVALRGIEADVRRWLDETGKGRSVRLGLVEGEAMLYGDWRAVHRAAGGSAVELDPVMQTKRDRADYSDAPGLQAARIAQEIADNLGRCDPAGRDLRSLLLQTEDLAYRGDPQTLRSGIEDVRWRVGIGPASSLSRVPDEATPITRPMRVEMSVRYNGSWATLCFVLQPRSSADSARNELSS